MKKKSLMALFGALLCLSCADKSTKLQLDEREQVILQKVQERDASLTDLEEFAVKWDTRIPVMNTDYLEQDLKVWVDSVQAGQVDHLDLEQLFTLKDDRYHTKPNAFGYLVTYRQKGLPFAANVVAVFPTDSSQVSIHGVDYTDENHSVYYAGEQKNLYKQLQNLMRTLKNK